MNSLRFYIFFNIFNILLISFIIFCVYVSAVLTFDIQGSPGSDIRFLYGAVIFITYITLKDDFYVSLNLLNILLCICMFGMFLIFFIACYIAPNWIAPCCLIVLYIITKIFLLHILFVNVAKFFPNSELIKVAEELKTNSTRRKYSLLLALCYDAAVALYFAFPLFLKPDFGSLLFFPILWEIYTLGGVLMFYIALFGLWKIQGKLK